MSHTIKNTKYWFNHDPAKRRRAMNKAFRVNERQYFKKFGEIFRPTKERGYNYW
jgi:hypothetical protein